MRTGFRASQRHKTVNTYEQKKQHNPKPLRIIGAVSQLPRFTTVAFPLKPILNQTVCGCCELWQLATTNKKKNAKREGETISNRRGLVSVRYAPKTFACFRSQRADGTTSLRTMVTKLNRRLFTTSLYWISGYSRLGAHKRTEAGHFVELLANYVWSDVSSANSDTSFGIKVINLRFTRRPQALLRMECGMNGWMSCAYGDACVPMTTSAKDVIAGKGWTEHVTGIFSLKFNGMNMNNLFIKFNCDSIVYQSSIAEQTVFINLNS